MHRSLPRLAVLRSLTLAAASAILMTLAVPNELFKHGLAPLGFIALIPLYIAILELPGPKSAALVTGVFGALQHTLTSFWLWFFQDYRIWTLGSTTLAYFVVYAVLGLYLWLFLSRGAKARPLGFILLWTCFEYQKSVGFLGYPWGLIPYSLTDVLPLLQTADIAGVYGITALLAACNAALAEIILGIGSSRRGPLSRRLRMGYSALALALVFGSLGYGLVRMAIHVPKIGSLDVILVQQDTDPWADEEEDSAVATDIRLAREALANAPRKPDLILFSETSLMRPYAESQSHYNEKPSRDPLIPFIRESGAWVFTGAPVVVDWKNQEVTNSAILIDPQARLVRSYAKVHLVPFAETIPFMEYPWFKNFINNVVGLESGWAAGKEFVVFDLPTKTGHLRFGAPICFEDAFADVCRNFSRGGADILINLTNIAWSKTESAEIQHWAAARFRSIESRKTLVRSTNGGVSCVVGPYGETLDSLPLFEPVSKFVEVPIFREAFPTIYIRWGDWFAMATLLLSGALSIILIVQGQSREVIA
ncbi:MAG: apolipoprotein N-acyltransferase [Rectinemataceae bacterium]